jgi:hypothetical protein
VDNFNKLKFLQQQPLTNLNDLSDYSLEQNLEKILSFKQEAIQRINEAKRLSELAKNAELQKSTLAANLALKANEQLPVQSQEKSACEINDSSDNTSLKIVSGDSVSQFYINLADTKSSVQVSYLKI